MTAMVRLDGKQTGIADQFNLGVEAVFVRNLRPVERSEPDCAFMSLAHSWFFHEIVRSPPAKLTYITGLFLYDLWAVSG